MDDIPQPALDNPLFEEVQRFRQPWLLILVFAVSTISIVPLLYGLYQQLVQGIPWGDEPMSDTGLILFSSFILLVLILMLVLLLGASLTIKVQGAGLYIRYWPVIRRFIPWDRITSYKAVTYSPLMDYGGWGIRGFGKKMAYNVSGNRGVLLHLSDSRSLLIGSQSPERLEQAICMASGNK